MTKKHKCEQCEKELTNGALFDLIKDDWVYHRYCKDCIRPQVKAIFEKLGRPDLILDEPRNFPHYKRAMNIITFNIENLLLHKMQTDPEFAKKTKEITDNMFPEIKELDKIEKETSVEQ